MLSEDCFLKLYILQGYRYLVISLYISLSLQDRSLVHEVLEANMDDNTRVVALESYTELLELLDGIFLHGGLLRQAETLMNLVTD